MSENLDLDFFIDLFFTNLFFHADGSLNWLVVVIVWLICSAIIYIFMRKKSIEGGIPLALIFGIISAPVFFVLVIVGTMVAIGWIIPLICIMISDKFSKNNK